MLVYNIYLLGQPNLLLLALLLGSFACLRLGRPIGAGALLATAAAIKAFPILALGYLIYRRMWTASAATVAVLAAWLLLAPLPFRTPAQAVDDLVVWSQGMLFTYNTHGIAQRPFRSYSYKNQSIMALAHRLLRDVPADGESVLSRRAKPCRAAAFEGTATHRPIDRPAYFPEAPRRRRTSTSAPPRARGSRQVSSIGPSREHRTSLAVGRFSPGCRIRAAHRVEGQHRRFEFSGGDGDHPGRHAGSIPVCRGRLATEKSPDSSRPMPSSLLWSPY